MRNDLSFRSPVGGALYELPPAVILSIEATIENVLFYLGERVVD